MTANVYEGMFILDSGRYGRDPEGVSGAIPQMIEQLGGEVLVNRLWEERRLAYPIRGQRKGTYWLSYFRLDASKLAELDRNSQLNDNILRFLFLKVDPRIVDTLVAHATGGRVASPSGAGGPKEAGTPTEAGDRGSGDGEEAGRQKAEVGSGERQVVEAAEGSES